MIDPNFYQTSWFYGLCALAVVLAGVGLYSLRVKRLKTRERELVLLLNERAKELQQEIAEHRGVKEALGQQRHLLRTLLDNLPDAIYFKDTESRFIRTNRAHAERWFGLSDPAQAVGKTDFDFFSEKHARQAYEDEQEIIRTGQPLLNIEERETWPDRPDTWVLTSKMPLRDEEGKVIGTFGITKDITERKQMEEALRQEQYLLRTLLDNLPEAIYFKDIQSRFIRTNRAHAERWFGLSDPAQAVGKTDFDFFSEEHARQAYEDEQEIIRTGQPLLNIEERETWPDRPDTWVLTSKMPLRDEEGKIIGTFGITRDITERKRAEEEIKRYAAELERSNGDLQQFAYVASHDLQEPLRMVASYTNLLARRYKGKLDNDADEFIHFIVDATGRMQILISDLLAYARVETQAQPFELTDTEAVLNQALTNLQVVIQERQAVMTHAPLPKVLADGRQLVQVFQNLISNAIKFCEEKHPEVHVAAEAREREWLFSVRDNGIGIDPKYADGIFQIFQRLHGKGEYSGTGIGLAVCKKIVERHGGRIWVDSEPGKGSTFYFSLPHGSKSYERS